MNSRHYFLAFDVGAESGRALLGTLADGWLVLDEKHRFANPTSRLGGHLYWNLLAQWEELKIGLKKTAAAGVALAGIGVDTWGVDFGLLAGDGQILGNPFHYRDVRTDGVPEKVFAKLPRAQIFAATGIQFLQLNSLYQLAAMRMADDELLKAAKTLLFMPDLFNYFFTGKRSSEFSIASTSQMFDMSRGQWATGMLQTLGLPTNIFPPVVDSGTVLGPLRSDVAQECGVAAMDVIAPACHDTGSAVAAVPAQKDNWCYISSGTWSAMGAEIVQPIINDKTLKYNFTNEGGVGRSIRLLTNLIGMWPIQECRRYWIDQGQSHSYGELTALAGAARPFAAILSPTHGPLYTPGQMPKKIEDFCRQSGQTPPADKGQTIRTCLEALALSYRLTLNALEDILGHKISVIHIVGGGSQNELLNQMTADACARPVVAGPVEATAIGNLLVQAMAVGLVRDLADVRGIVRASFQPRQYEPRDTAAWDAHWERFCKLDKRGHC